MNKIFVINNVVKMALSPIHSLNDYDGIESGLKQIPTL